MARLKGLTLIPPDDLIQMRVDPKTGEPNNRDLRHAMDELTMEASSIAGLNMGDERYKDAAMAHYILLKFLAPWEELRRELEYKEAVGWAMTVIRKDMQFNLRDDLYQKKYAPLVQTVCEAFHIENRDYSLDKDNLNRLKVEIERTNVPPYDSFGG